MHSDSETRFACSSRTPLVFEDDVPDFGAVKSVISPQPQGKLTPSLKVGECRLLWLAAPNMLSSRDERCGTSSPVWADKASKNNDTLSTSLFQRPQRQWADVYAVRRPVKYLGTTANCSVDFRLEDTAPGCTLGSSSSRSIEEACGQTGPTHEQ